MHVIVEVDNDAKEKKAVFSITGDPLQSVPVLQMDAGTLCWSKSSLKNIGSHQLVLHVGVKH